MSHRLYVSSFDILIEYQFVSEFISNMNWFLFCYYCVISGKQVYRYCISDTIRLLQNSKQSKKYLINTKIICTTKPNSSSHMLKNGAADWNFLFKGTFITLFHFSDYHLHQSSDNETWLSSQHNCGSEKRVSHFTKNICKQISREYLSSV